MPSIAARRQEADDRPAAVDDRAAATCRRGRRSSRPDESDRLPGCPARAIAGERRTRPKRRP
ncbi:MAG: hypothetical protein MZU95_12885 [Desulfomicrobium escambiense]|nr:hypothetical protein [Desulfomicrobium escambiense]